MGWTNPEVIDTSPSVSDEVKATTCYMCACRCGIRVHLKDGRIRYIEGNKAHPVNKGVLCAKGSAGIMQHYSPARLSKPLLRVGERGSGDFKEIEWDEALRLATTWLSEVRNTDPRKLAFFTGRDQSQSLTGWWAQQFGTPNFAAHGGFCSVNMAAAGLYSIGGSFWEFGEPDWEHSRYFMMFGVAEDHDSNPIKAGLTRLKERGAKYVAVNPVRTAYAAVADEWIGIRPGTDGALVLALVHELLKAQKVDLDFLVRYTNAPWLVIEAPGTAEHGLFARDAEGRPLCFDHKSGAVASALSPNVQPALSGTHRLPDGRAARPSFALLAEKYIDGRYSPEAAAIVTGVPAATIRRLAAEIAHAAFSRQIELPIAWTDWAGRRHETMIGRPVAFHAMRGISAHANGFQTCRALHVLQMLLGAIDTPGAFRYKSPYPRACPPPLKPAGKPGQVEPLKPMPGPPLGFPMGPEDLLLEADGSARRIDKAYSWEAPVAAHGMMHLVIRNAWAGDPYPIEVLFMYMANMAWNSAMNSAGTIEMLTAKDAGGRYRIPRIIYADAFLSETVPYADLILPDTTYLERWDCVSMLDRPIGSAHGPADAIRQPVLQPDRDVRPFQDVLLDLGVRLGLPGMVKEDGNPRFPGGYADYLVNHERPPGSGIGPLAGWRGADGAKAGKGEPNPDQLARYVENGCFWKQELPETALYYKHANKAYLEHAVAMGFIGKAEQIVLQLYVEPMQKFRLAADGHGKVQPPDHLRARIREHFDPLPIWYPPFEHQAVSDAAFPLSAVTQRPAAMYHSWGSQNAWLRQIHGENRLFMNRATAAALGIADDDWVYVTSHHGRIKCQVKLMEGVNDRTVWTWNAIGKRAGAWNLDPRAPEARRGFLLNHLIAELLPEQGGHRLPNADPITGQAAWYDLRVRVEKAPAGAAVSEPAFKPLPVLPGVGRRPGILRYGEEIRAARLGGRGGRSGP
ncbi:MAG: molybdopterin oxidoreductase family protein [Alphaproteobacteria bacterium]|nr:molybdopterin oxidoreductase family protein [Alphaproteobacteria bacterium]